MDLFSFLYDTLLPKVNDPENGHFWLPKVLQDISGSNTSGKLLPLDLTDWSIGGITGEAGDTITKGFIQQWISYIHSGLHIFPKDRAIADPSGPVAMLSFNSATIVGLHNLSVLANPVVHASDQGYQATIILQTNFYDGTSGRPSVTTLGIQGTYDLSQKLCTADTNTSTTCNGHYYEKIDGQGQADISINNAFIEADINISIDGSGATRSAKVTVTRVSMRGAAVNSTPDLVINTLTVVSDLNKEMQDAWLSSSQTALTSPDGQAGIFGQINASLNSPYNLNSLSDTITTQLQLVLNDLIGAVPGNGLPSDASQHISNAADLYVFDRMRFSLNDAGGQWYLPKIVCSFNSPSLEPLTIGEIDLPEQNIMGMNVTSIKLLNTAVTGLSNMLIPSNQMIFDEDMGLKATVVLSALTSPPSGNYSGKTIPLPPLKGTGSFAMMFEGDPETYPGTFTLEVNSSQLAFSTKPGGSDVDSLTIAVLSAVISVDPANVLLNISVDSDFNDIINQVLNQPGIKNTIIAQINDALASNLNAISTQVTASARAGIASRLNG